MSSSRPTKHGRADELTSGANPKRVKEAQEMRESTQRSEMSWEKLEQEERKRGQKRDNVEVEGSTEAGSRYNSDVEEEDTIESEVQDSIVKSKKGKGKKPSKSARIEGKDSPSKVKDKGQRERQAQLHSAGSTKGKGKRVIDDSEDREIGEAWTDLNGLNWKMGEDGQIRREAIVVEMRPKYPSMPKDSRHPDAKIKVPVFVERYLTEREYEEAREKKLLSFQEMDRQRDLEEVEAAAKKKQQKEADARQKRAMENGRQVTTPKKIRDLQALFHPGRKPSSPLSNTLPLSVSRSSSLSTLSSHPNTPYTSVKRLSLSMGRDEAEATSPTPPKPITPQAATQTTTPPKAKMSYRLSLASPSSPGVNKTNAASVRGSPLSDVKAKRKREETLLKLLQEEAERRKRREGVQ